jgi:DNA-binding transcriptional ArsR family regulator
MSPTPRDDRMEDVLVALADGTRRRILDAIAARGEATATTLAVHLPVSRQAVVKHLAVLDRAGLVTAQRRGREMLYDVRPTPLQATARWLERTATTWTTRLTTLKRLAESK